MTIPFNITWELRRAVKIFQNITASLGNLDPCLARITLCYLCFLHSACLGQNCSAEAPSNPAKSVHPKTKQQTKRIIRKKSSWNLAFFHLLSRPLTMARESLGHASDGSNTSYSLPLRSPPRFSHQQHFRAHVTYIFTAMIAICISFLTLPCWGCKNFNIDCFSPVSATISLWNPVAEAEEQ